MVQLLSGFNKDLPARIKNVLRDMIQKKSYCNNLREMWEVFEIKKTFHLSHYIYLIDPTACVTLKCKVRQSVSVILYEPPNPTLAQLRHVDCVL